MRALAGLAAAVALAPLHAIASDLEARMATANLKRGQSLYLACKGCHDLEAGVPHRVGPNLNGVVGRRAGTAEGFRFSEPLARSGIVWTPETLDSFLRQPGAMVRGNRMAFAGIANDADRASLIAWMLANGAVGQAATNVSKLAGIVLLVTLVLIGALLPLRYTTRMHLPQRPPGTGDRGPPGVGPGPRP